MARPCKCRRVSFQPGVSYFKPRRIPLDRLEEVILTLDEFESVRLADLEGMYQDRAAEQMKVSRQTFGNIVNSAHKKIADALVNAKAIRIEGGVCQMTRMKNFRCFECGHVWGTPYGIPRPGECPRCKNNNIHRTREDRGAGRCGFGRGPGRYRRSPV